MPGAKKVDFDELTRIKVKNAIDEILNGTCSKVVISDNVKVYKCTNILRVDLKVVTKD